MSGLVYYLLGLITSILIGYFIEWTWPSLKTRIDKSIFSSRQKRIESLQHEYKSMKKVKENPIEFGYGALLILAQGFSEIVILIFAVGLDVVFVLNSSTRESPDNYVTNALFITALWGLIPYMTFKSFSSLVLDIRHFQKYREKTIKKLEKLGATLDEAESNE